MIALVIIIILVVYFFYILNKQDKHIKELNHINLKLKQKNEDMNFDKNRYKRILKEIEKAVYIYDNKSKDFQLRKIKEILIRKQILSFCVA